MENEEGEVVSQWSEVARYWEKHREIINVMFAPVTEALVQDAGIGSGHAVLDVATGPGEPALTIAGLVGSRGEVLGIDIVPGMVEAAGREADRRRLGNVRFETAPAGKLPAGNDTFDAAVSRFGVMFFPSPLDGIREMLRVLKPGGKLAMAVWHFAENNPFHYVLSRIVGRFVDSPPPDPDSPDAFRFAPPGMLLHVVRQAGAVDVNERLLKFAIEVPLPAEDFWTLRYEMSDKIRAKLGPLAEDQIAEIRREFMETVRAYSGGNGLSFPAEVLIVSGRKLGHTQT